MLETANKINDKKKLIIVIVYYSLMSFVGWFLFGKKMASLEMMRLIYAVIFFGIMPLILIRNGFREKLIKYNIPVGYFKKQIILALGSVWLGSLLIWLFVLQWEGEIARNILWRNTGLIWLTINDLFLLPIGLFAQEFFFRGVLLNKLRGNFANWLAVVIVAMLVMIFGMVTVGQWMSLLAIAGGLLVNIVLGYGAIKFRSVVFSFWLYWLTLILIKFLILGQLGMRL